MSAYGGVFGKRVVAADLVSAIAGGGRGLLIRGSGNGDRLVVFVLYYVGARGGVLGQGVRADNGVADIGGGRRAPATISGSRRTGRGPSHDGRANAGSRAVT